ncbi:MAG: hypothetical protein E7472_05500 [Ruminococcaceae bacterium]|nr:hypothetical protein [Oscillospiraceae bacterium]
MSEYRKTVEVMECDRFAQLSPKQILEHCLSLTLIDIERDGCGKAAIFDTCGAIWMISNMRFYQYAPIYPHDEIVYRTFPRVIGKNRYILYVEICRGEECVIRFDTAYIPVHKQQRHLVSLSLLDPLWTAPARTSDYPALRPLRPECAFSDCGSDTVRLSDCDINGHMTSGAYLSLACDAAGFWESETPRLMRMMQVDFCSEVMPGTLLRFERGEENGACIVRGVKPDGKVAFVASCVF